jgi:hypothetical protein
MPLFYFDVRDDGQSFPDDEGQHLASIDAAEAEVAEAAAAIAVDVLPARRSGELVIEVRDAGRELLLTVSVALRVQRIPETRVK